MFDPLELFRSVECIWIVWLISCLGLAVMTVWGISRVRWCHFFRMAGDEEGAAYALSYVMVVPLYFIFVCLVVESSNILITKVGTVYAAYAGARTAIVWDSATTASDVRQRTIASARQAFVPFATGIRTNGASVPALTSEQRKYLNAYEDYVSGNGVSRGNMETKLNNTREELSVEYLPPVDWADDAEVKVTYRFRFHVPVIGHALGTRDADGYRYFSIRTSVKLQNEGPQNDSKRMGISYASPN
jgi:hypothetical protein